MDRDEELLRGRIYGTDHVDPNPGPRSGRGWPTRSAARWTAVARFTGWTADEIQTGPGAGQRWYRSVRPVPVVGPGRRPAAPASDCRPPKTRHAYGAHGHTDRMHHTTAVRQLRAIADSCGRAATLFPDQPLLAVYAFGPVLDGPDGLDVVDAVFAIDVPPAEVPWGIEPPACRNLAAVMRWDKAPVRRFWRPAARPVANHLIRRPLRIWTPAGPDDDALHALAERRADPLRLPDPDADTARRQREAERAEALTHLRTVRDRFNDPEWRRRHRGDGLYPETYLWGAVDGYLDLTSPDASPSR